MPGLQRPPREAIVTTALAIALLVLTIPALLINLYFALLLFGRWPGLRDSLGALFRTCGADTSSCAIVVRTPCPTVRWRTERSHRYRMEPGVARPRPRVDAEWPGHGAVAVPDRRSRERTGRALSRPRAGRRPATAVPAVNCRSRPARGGRRAAWSRPVGRLTRMPFRSVARRSTLPPTRS